MNAKLFPLLLLSVGAAAAPAVRGVVASYPWQADDETELRVSVSEPQPGQMPRILTVSGGKLPKPCSFETGDSYLTGYYHPPWGCLVTLWEGGSAFHVNVFRYSNHRVELVLQTGSKELPIISPVERRCPDVEVVDHMGTKSKHSWQAGQYVLLQ